MPQKVAGVLHIEDDTIDARLLHHIFQEHGS